MKLKRREFRFVDWDSKWVENTVSEFVESYCCFVRGGLVNITECIVGQVLLVTIWYWAQE